MNTEERIMIRQRIRGRMKGLTALLVATILVFAINGTALAGNDNYFLIVGTKGSAVSLSHGNVSSFSEAREEMELQFNPVRYVPKEKSKLALDGIIGSADMSEAVNLTIEENTILMYGSIYTYSAAQIEIKFDGTSKGTSTYTDPKGFEISKGKYSVQHTSTTTDAYGTYTIDIKTAITLSETSLSFTVGDAAKSLTVDPSMADVIWSSDNKSVATVDENGKVTPVGVGTATITATLESDSSVKATCTVTVNAKKDAEPGAQPESQSQAPVNIQLNSNLFVRWKGNNVAVSWGTASGADSYEVWATYCGTSTFEKVMDVQSGNKATIKKLKGKKLNKKRGVKVYVVAKQAGANLGRTLYGHSASSKNPRTNAKKVMVKKKSYSLTVGQTAKIKATTVKEKSRKKLLHDGYYRYASSNTSVATVNSSGRITAVGAGACDVWVYALNGRSKKMTVTVK